MSEPLVLRERDGDVVTLILNLPERLNAMTQAMGEAFQATTAELAGDPSLRAVVLTGSGRAFSAGGDLGMIGGRAEQAGSPAAAQRVVRDTMQAFYKLFLSVRDLPCPTVAALHGPAIGAGFCVALACDLRVVSETAKLGLNFTRLGLHPGMGATWTLPRLVGPALAAELLYTGRILLGEELRGTGLANRVLPAEQVLPAARELAREVAGSAPRAVRGVKQALRRSEEVSLEDQLAFEASQQAACFQTQDVKEGLAAVRERREPRFQGS